LRIPCRRAPDLGGILLLLCVISATCLNNIRNQSFDINMAGGSTESRILFLNLHGDVRLVCEVGDYLVDYICNDRRMLFVEALRKVHVVVYHYNGRSFLASSIVNR